MISTLVVIAICTAIQSVYGVGLLLFGIPTFLILGFEYNQALSVALPCSLMISLLQFSSNLERIRPFPFMFWITAVPGLIFGVWLHHVFDQEISFRKLVGIVVLGAAILRLSSTTYSYLKSLSFIYAKRTLFVIGFVHGMTTMGGSLLAIFASARADGKDGAREMVVYGYTIFSFLQIVMLTFMGNFKLSLDTIYSLILCIIIYLFLGRILFIKATEFFYQAGLSYLLLAYGLILILR